MLTLLTSTIGKWMAAIGAVCVVIGGIALKAFASGKAAQQSADNQTALTSQTEVTHVENQVAATPASARRDELQRWSAK